MGLAILIMLMIVVVFTSFHNPFISIVAYYFMSLLSPQYIWFWVFEGIPVFKVFAGVALIVFSLSSLAGKLDFKIYKSKQNMSLIIIFVFVHLSDIFSPFPIFFAAVSSELVLKNLNIIILFYFISLPLLTSEKALRYSVVMFIGVVIYYIYWSNNAYFTDEWYRFVEGRLPGPRRSPYQDENKFGVLFVTGLPFLAFGFFYYKSLLIKYGLALFALFLLNSIFLTGSRGALLAVAVTTMFIAKNTNSKKFTIIILVGFIFAVVYQGATVVNRGEETAAASQQEEGHANPRLKSWGIGIDIIKIHPLLGVGVQRFQHASAVLFPGRGTYVAHNTFFQLASNSGLITGLLFIFIYYYNYKKYKLANLNGIARYPYLDYLNKALFASLTGFYVTSIFLDLMIYEIFYFILLLSEVKNYHFFKLVQSKQV